MKRLAVDLAERSYEIQIDNGLLEKSGEVVRQATIARRAVVVTNPTIRSLFGDTVTSSLERAGFLTNYITIPEGEEFKTLASAERVFDHLLAFHCDRSSVLIALGGGVIGDLTGFVAATFMRGIPLVQIPTTLLAQVDSSVGGKTAVNHPKGKNIIGAFYQPKAVIIDLNTLKTLPAVEFRAGLAEVIKYGVIADSELFKYLENNYRRILNLDPKYLSGIIETSCSIKATIVEKDERENRYRMILNFGHTLGHAIEALTHYKKYKHGEAVAIGMVFAAKLSADIGRCDKTDERRIAALVEKFGLPTRVMDLEPESIIQSMYHDKKTSDRNIKFILTCGVGSIEIEDHIPEELLKKSLDDFRRLEVEG
tara:strand:- start:2368 stop:3468 length:1101 start_codon:yes stop_codon:yes gene_type:complete